MKITQKWKEKKTHEWNFKIMPRFIRSIVSFLKSISTEHRVYSLDISRLWNQGICVQSTWNPLMRFAIAPWRCQLDFPTLGGSDSILLNWAKLMNALSSLLSHLEFSRPESAWRSFWHHFWTVLHFSRPKSRASTWMVLFCLIKRKSPKVKYCVLLNILAFKFRSI